MKPILMVMLAAQVAGFLAAAWSIGFGRAVAGRRRPVLSSLALMLVIVSGTSFQISERHAGQPGADIVAWAAPFLLGIGVAAMLMLIRQRRGLGPLE